MKKVEKKFFSQRKAIKYAEHIIKRKKEGISVNKKSSFKFSVTWYE